VPHIILHSILRTILRTALHILSDHIRAKLGINLAGVVMRAGELAQLVVKPLVDLCFGRSRCECIHFVYGPFASTTLDALN
jgi:hypothetical protein